jgi:hypothetical protein
MTPRVTRTPDAPARAPAAQPLPERPDRFDDLLLMFAATGNPVAWGTLARASRSREPFLTSDVQTKEPEFVAVLHQVMTRLDEEVGALEAQNAGKQAEVATLVTQLETAKADVQTEYDKKMMVGAIAAALGAPSLVKATLALAVADDAKCQTLNASIAVAKGDQAALEARLVDYRATKKSLTEKLDTLQQAEPLLAKLPVPSGARGLSKLADSGHRHLQTASLVQNLESQVDVLTQLRDAARAVGVDLDGVLQRLQGQLVEARALVEASRQQTLELFKLALAKDPQHAAIDWARAKVDAQVRQQLEGSIGRLLGPGATPEAKGQWLDLVMKHLAAP